MALMWKKAAIAAAITSTVIISLGLSAGNQGDIAWYQFAIHQWAAGALPYIGHMVEYPPYALIIFGLPWLIDDSRYLLIFLVMAFIIDIAIKAILFRLGQKKPEDSRSWLPLLAYSIGAVLCSYVYLQRFDLWPALIGLIAVLLFIDRKHLSSGAMLSIAVGVKLYPIVFGLPMLAIAIREKQWKRFAIGIIAGALPILLLSFVLPWWRFALVQGSRGLQAESIYASAIWLAHLIYGVPAFWIHTTAWFEVQGPIASAVVPWARIFFGASMIAATVIATRSAWRASSRSAVGIGRLSRILLIPLLAFVAFNLVLSPQYMIWLIPMAALAALEGSIWPVAMILLAAALVPAFYPSYQYFSANGLDLLQTWALFARNMLLAVSCIWLAVSEWRARVS